MHFRFSSIRLLCLFLSCLEMKVTNMKPTASNNNNKQRKNVVNFYFVGKSCFVLWAFLKDVFVQVGSKWCTYKRLLRGSELLENAFGNAGSLGMNDATHLCTLTVKWETKRHFWINGKKIIWNSNFWKRLLKNGFSIFVRDFRRLHVMFDRMFV